MTSPTKPAAAPRPKIHPTGRQPLLHPASFARTTLFISITLVAYVLTNACILYLSSGQWVSTSVADFGREFSRSLGDVLVNPLNVFTHPWLLLVFGLLLAAEIVVPLLVACLYPLRFCIPFLLFVVGLAQAPVLALFLTAGCLLVGRTKLRSNSPVLALLLGLLPVSVYLYFSSSRSPIITQPMQQFVLYVPFLIAGLGTIVAGVTVLIIVHLLRYRPGAVWPVLVVLLAAPGWLFYRYIGPDELAYAVIADRLTLSESVFPDQTRQQWRQLAPRGLSDEELARRIETDLRRRKREVLADCEEFARRFPRSRRLSSVLWIQGITQDTQLNRRAYAAGLVQYYDSFPLSDPTTAADDSRQSWQQLADLFRGDVRAGFAHWRLALLELRNGRPGEAMALLDEAAGMLADTKQPAPSVSPNDSPWAVLFSDDDGIPSRGYLLRTADEVNILRWRIRTSRAVEDPAAAQALGLFTAMDPLQMSCAEYRERITQLEETRAHMPDGTVILNPDGSPVLYKQTGMAGHLALDKAMSVDSAVERAGHLLQLQDRLGEASVAALFELGRLATQVKGTPGLAMLPLDRPVEYFRRVAAVEDNPWQEKAREQVRLLESAQENTAP